MMRIAKVIVAHLAKCSDEFDDVQDHADYVSDKRPEGVEESQGKITSSLRLKSTLCSSCQIRMVDDLMRVLGS